MNSKIFHRIRLVTTLTLLALLIIYCSKDPNGDGTDGNIASCEGCHTNYAHLQEVYSPDTTETASGCGGEAPHYEPFDRVFMEEEGYDIYRESGHYEIGCTGCHKGTDNTSDKTTAHSGDFISHPSLFYEQSCGSSSCHESIVENFETSLHQGTGQMRKVAIRSGLSGADDFDNLPDDIAEAFGIQDR